MNITVLHGGPSSERSVSLISGRSVIDALRKAGHRVYAADISAADTSALDRPCDVVFPALHGAFGEDGQVQRILEERDIPYVGSGVAASELCIDKARTREACRAAGVPVARGEVLTTAQRTINAPCVVKAIDGGSSIDVFMCRDEAAAQHAVQTLLSKFGRCLVEEFVEGTEITVGLLHDAPLPPIRIENDAGKWFDYESKYSDKGARHAFDLRLPKPAIDAAVDAAMRACRACDCRDLARVDLIVRPDGQPCVLEINTMPGFTPRSLLPDAANRAGIPFVHLVDGLVRAAYARWRNRQAAVA